MKNLIIVSIQLFIVLAVKSQEFPIVKPETVALSSERLDRIKPFMQNYIDENKIPGMITMVARHGKIVHLEKYGVMDENKSMELNSIFRIASMSKPIISVAIMMLYEEGYFQLNDPVSKFIPEFKDLKVFVSKDSNGIVLEDQKNHMTIRDLLTHTSGLTYGHFGNTPVDSMYRKANLFEGTLKDMINKLAKIPLLYQPGTKWNYSVSIDVLGYLIEIISGEPLDKFLKERIFIPLKMTDTDFYVPEEKINRFTALYDVTNIDSIKYIDRPKVSIQAKPVKFFSGGGGLVSTALDYLKFSQMLLNKGELNRERLLGSRTVELMTKNHLPDSLLPIADWLHGMGFGLGFSVMVDNIDAQILGSIGEYFWLGIDNTYFWIDPKEDMILILFAQFLPYTDPFDLQYKVLVYQAIID